MAHGTREGGIQTFWPDDTEDTLYIDNGLFESSLEEIWKKIRAKWPGIKMSELSFGAEHIHTNCLGYDLYDSSDYTNFICIKASLEYFKRINQASPLVLAK